MSIYFAIVIVTYNRKNYLEKTLKSISLLENFNEVLKVVVVNNRSNDGTEEFLLQYAKTDAKLEVITTEKNLGGAGGFARGIKAACCTDAEWIGVMDDDVELHPRALIEIAKHAEPHRILGCLRIDEKGRVVERASKRYDLSTIFRLNPRRGALCDISTEPTKFEELESVAFSSFEGMFFSRELIEVIGFPYSEYFIFGDDCDFCLRARAQGWNVAIVRDARLTRLIPYDRQTSFTSWKRYYIWRNFFILHLVYGENPIVRAKPYAYTLMLFLKRPFKILDTLRCLREARTISQTIRHRLVGRVKIKSLRKVM